MARFMTKVNTTSSIAIIALFDLLLDHGITPNEIEKMTGIDASLVGESEVKIEIPKMVRLWDAGIKTTSDPALGLNLRGNYGKHFTHFVVTIARNSTTLAEAARHWSRYAKLISEVDQIDIAESDDQYILTYSNTCSKLQCISMIEHDMSKAVCYMRELTQQDCHPLEVTFCYPEPEYRSLYDEIFQCPLHFNQKENRIVMPRDLMQTKIIGRDHHLHAVLKKHADSLLQVYEQSELFSQKVETWLTENLPLGKLTLDSAADYLNVSRSTLHRKLKQEQTSFSDILEKTRKELACYYFKSGMNNVQTAFLLGFTDPSSFQHAFRRWYGVSPGEFRKDYRVRECGQIK